MPWCPWIVAAFLWLLIPLATSPAKAADDPLDCLAKAIYFEAKGQSDEAMQATAAVVMNRTENPEFPHDVCGVVHEKTAASCQFGWYCDGKPDRPSEPAEWQRAVDVAKATLAGEVSDPTEGALYFHTVDVPAPWEIERRKTVTIGPFVYYKETAAHAAELAKERARKAGAE